MVNIIIVKDNTYELINFDVNDDNDLLTSLKSQVLKFTKKKIRSFRLIATHSDNKNNTYEFYGFKRTNKNYKPNTHELPPGQNDSLLLFGPIVILRKNKDTSKFNSLSIDDYLRFREYIFDEESLGSDSPISSDGSDSKGSLVEFIVYDE